MGTATAASPRLAAPPAPKTPWWSTTAPLLVLLLATALAAGAR
ncbi:MAG: hypothetical protein U0325_31710 [Polyangiales bacterium]